jgi:uncharacterized protein YlxP (DUF503 family)
MSDDDDCGYAGLLVVDLHVAGARSLKDKRAPLRSLRQRLRNAGYTVAEVAFHDAWQRSRLAIGVVSRAARDADALLDEALRVLERDGVEAVARERGVMGLRDLDA